MSHQGVATRSSIALVMMMGDGPTLSISADEMPGLRNFSTTGFSLGSVPIM